MTDLEKYYNKFNEDKRLTTRQGQVEYITSMKYIHECIDNVKVKKGDVNSISDIKIIDIGAGTGRYSVALALEGYDTTAVELVAYNLGILKSKSDLVKAYKGNALNLKRFEDNCFDVSLLFGPMYHLHDYKDKVRALSEAVRVTRPGGYVLVAYCMNEYSVLTYAFKDKHIKESIANGDLDENFKVMAGGNELYDVMRLEDIDIVNKCFNDDSISKRIARHKIISADGAATYMRQMLRSLDDEEFELFLKYHFATCERSDLLGASWHTVDILEIY